MDYCCKHNLIVEIELLQSNTIDVYGNVIILDEGEIEVSMINEEGKTDGSAIVDIVSISRVCFNSVE